MLSRIALISSIAAGWLVAGSVNRYPTRETRNARSQRGERSQRDRR
jgi:hypothetical protein